MHLDLNHLYIINYILRIPPLITTGMYCHALGAWGQASGVYVGVAACGKSVSSISRSLVFQTCLLHTSICYFESASDRQSKQIPFVNFKSTRSHSRAGVMIKKIKDHIYRHCHECIGILKRFWICNMIFHYTFCVVLWVAFAVWRLAHCHDEPWCAALASLQA